MDIELLQPDFITQGIKDLIKEAKTMFRLNVNGKRYYASVENGVEWYPSVTTIISNVVPKSVGMQLLMQEKGREFSSWMAELAHQGTFIHTEIGDYLLKREEAKYSDEEKELYSFDDFEERIRDFMHYKRLNYDIKKWDIELKPKVVSFLRFIDEYEVEPLAVELIVNYSDDMVQFAGAMDLLAYVSYEEKGFWGEVYKTTAKKGLPKETKQKVRKLAAIDFKTGTSGFYPEYELQLQMYRRAYKQMTGVEVDMIMNVSPTKFMTGNTPGYRVKEWKDSDESLLDIYLDLHSRTYEKPKEIAQYKGSIMTGDSIESLFSYTKADDVVLGLDKVKKYLETKELETV
jgi:hypothetical protein